MIFDIVFDKSTLLTLLQQTFYTYGYNCGSTCLDSLKQFSLSFATQAGFSLGLLEFNTLNFKTKLLCNPISYFNMQSHIISSSERFNYLIEQWGTIIEEMKYDIINFFQTNYPFNLLYILINSGARGTMTQGYQIFGTRGLMTDMDGNLYNFPILANLFEGLQITDYIISSYGARKGVLDTVLHTADSGALTKRIITVTQDIVIRQLNCQTKKGITFFIPISDILNFLLGKYITNLYIISSQQHIIFAIPILINHRFISNIIHFLPIRITIRSPLTCSSMSTICQVCYGWTLNKLNLISLGSTIGIITAHVLSEPTTQLVMQTFHSGGILAEGNNTLVRAEISGLLTFVENPINKCIRFTSSTHQFLYYSFDLLNIIIENWNLQKEYYTILAPFILYEIHSRYIKKHTLLAISTTAFNFKEPDIILKQNFFNISGFITMYSGLIGTILTPNLLHFFPNKNNLLKLNSSFKAQLPIELKLINNSNKSNLGLLKIIVPLNGTIIFNNDMFYVWVHSNNIIKFKLKFEEIYSSYFYYTIFIFSKNYQYLDSETIIGYLLYKSKLPLNIDIYYSKTQNIYSKINIIYTINLLKDYYYSNNTLIKKIYENIRQNNLIPSIKVGEKIQNISLNVIKCDSNCFLINKLDTFIYKNQILNYSVESETYQSDITKALPYIENFLLDEIEDENEQVSEPLLSSDSGLIFVNSTFKKSFEISNNYIFYNSSFLLHYQANILSILYNSTICIDYNNLLFKLILLSFVQKNLRYSIIPIQNKVLYIYTLYKYNRNVKLIQLWYYYKINLVIYKINYTCYILQIDEYSYILTSITKPNLPIFNLDLINVDDYLVNSKFNIEYYNFGLIQPYINLKVDDCLFCLFEFYKRTQNIFIAISKTIYQTGLILLNTFQLLYQKHNISISNKFFEILFKELLSYLQIIEDQNNYFDLNEILHISTFELIYQSLVNSCYLLPNIIPLYYNITTYSELYTNNLFNTLESQAFPYLLLLAAFEGTTNWLNTIMDNILLNNCITYGTSFLNYKIYYDYIYSFKSKIN